MPGSIFGRIVPFNKCLRHWFLYVHSPRSFSWAEQRVVKKVCALESPTSLLNVLSGIARSAFTVSTIPALLEAILPDITSVHVFDIFA